MNTGELSPRGTRICRACGSDDLRSVLDLGSQPLANRLLREATDPDPVYPLHLRICAVCSLGQVGEFVSPEEIFGDYPYLSSMSSVWLEHVRTYATHMRTELALRDDDFVVEIASNDGHLLKGFQDMGHRVLGVEPAGNVAAIARAAGIPTTCTFFGRAAAEQLVAEHGVPRLVAANNVLAHVPDLDDFVSGLAGLCGPDTVVTIENPTLTELLAGRQFDTIYHEHFSYLSATSVDALARRHDLVLVRVERLPTHGGSLRYWLRRRGADVPDASVGAAIEDDRRRGLTDPAAWQAFARECLQTVEGLRGWLQSRHDAGDVVVGYGAAAKGNTLLNAVGDNASFLRVVADASPEKVGRLLPGSHVPVVAPSALAETDPADVLLLPWNIETELVELVAALAPAAACWVAVPEMRKVTR
ncbi:MAG: methyltransferase domain-containing protein [Nocardioidaceae bacterium]|nr:methyltransferase domain-containing protein [Nocardioidaceae bacterium]